MLRSLVGSEMCIRDRHIGEIGAVAFLEDKALAEMALAKGKAVASGDADGTVLIWDLNKIAAID